MIISFFKILNILTHKRSLLEAQMASCAIKIVLKLYFDNFIHSFSNIEMMFFFLDLAVSVLISFI